jgi:hypothetical protein
MDKFWNINIILVINKKQQAKQAATWSQKQVAEG